MQQPFFQLANQVFSDLIDMKIIELYQDDTGTQITQDSRYIQSYIDSLTHDIYTNLIKHNNQHLTPNNQRPLTFNCN
jgi:hypothetical protein